MVDDIYLFFYGSMVNKHSRTHTIKKTTKGIPVVIKQIDYKCSYNFSSNRNTNSTRFTVLGLMKSNNRHTIPGIVVKVSKKELVSEGNQVPLNINTWFENCVKRKQRVERPLRRF